jgi:hypothetical protein
MACGGVAKGCRSLGRTLVPGIVLSGLSQQVLCCQHSGTCILRLHLGRRGRAAHVGDWLLSRPMLRLPRVPSTPLAPPSRHRHAPQSFQDRYVLLVDTSEMDSARSDLSETVTHEFVRRPGTGRRKQHAPWRSPWDASELCRRAFMCMRVFAHACVSICVWLEAGRTHTRDARRDEQVLGAPPLAQIDHRWRSDPALTRTPPPLPPIQAFAPYLPTSPRPAVDP